MSRKTAQLTEFCLGSISSRNMNNPILIVIVLKDLLFLKFIYPHEKITVKKIFENLLPTKIPSCNLDKNIIDLFVMSDVLYHY